MMSNILSSILFLGILVTAEGAGEDDRIDALPGVNFHYNFSQYSGYLNAGNGGKWKFFYWLMESQTGNSDNDPLMVLTSAGPGSSAIGSLFGEMGPFHVGADSQTVFENIFAWNKYANILSIEFPVGVGFSYNADDPKNYTVGDDLTANQTLTALIDFFTNVQPKYSKRQWFISGMSYGGIYSLSTARLVLQSIKNGTFPNTNFRGITIGNGKMEIKLLVNTLVLWANYHGLIGVREWDIIKEKCCTNITSIDDCPFADHFDPIYMNNPKDDCGNMLLYYLNVTTFSPSNTLMDPFNIYQDCYESNYLTNPTNIIDKILLGISNLIKPASQLNYDSTDNQFGFPCYKYYSGEFYLNQPEVQKALHIDDSWIKDNGKWFDFQYTIMNNYPVKYADSTELFNDVIKLVTDPEVHIPTFRIMSYNGDLDASCNYLGNTRHINNIANINNFDHMPRYPWVFRNRLAGYHQPYLLKYNNDQSILFMDDLVVKGSGHIVPNDRPGPTSQMIYNFIKNIGHYNFTEGFNDTPSPMSEVSSPIINTVFFALVISLIIFSIRKLI